MLQVSEISKIRRKVLSEVARLTFAGTLRQNIGEILNNVVSEEGPRYRCCVHKERAVLADRINLALSQSMDCRLRTAADRALVGKIVDMPIINVMPVACDQCPIDKFMVTDACRNCLAHSCIASCPKKAIMVIQGRAYIDKNRCVECGLCKKSCQFGAIIEVNRPCERACPLEAIKAGSDRRAAIDYDKCVQCGACKTACPFGAIGDRSVIVQVIQQLKAGKKLYAMLAPAVIGQFGMKVKPGQVNAGLKKLGFFEVTEASLGADIVTLEESKEFLENVPAEKAFMTTSCCPAFVSMIEKHLPELKGHISSTVSPMIAAAKLIKANDPEAVVVFCGPCTAKKAEALRYPGLVDFVLTFEELAAMAVGGGVNFAEMEEGEYQSAASRDGNGFARAGGVAQAVLNTAAALAPEVKVIHQRCDGLANCKAALQQIRDGKLNANFVEGMACSGGCVGGPAILTDSRVTTKMVETFAAQSQTATAAENDTAVAESKRDLHWHHD